MMKLFALTLLALAIATPAHAEPKATLHYHLADCNKPNSDKPNWAYFAHGTWWLQCRAYKTAKTKKPEIIYIPTEKSPQEAKP